MYTIEGYLPEYIIKKRYFNKEKFFQWVIDYLLSRYQLQLGPNSVIIMDNVLTYCYPSIGEVIRTRDYLVRCLFPYFSEFNSIELFFNVLKAWVRRRFDFI